MRKFLLYLKSSFIVFLYDITVIPVAWFLAYFLRYNLGQVPISYLQNGLKVLPVLIVIQLFFYWLFGLYRGVWRFASMPDLIRIIKAVIAGSLVSFLALFLMMRLAEIPRSVFPIYMLLLIILLGGARLFYRYFKDRGHLTLAGTRVLIIGAGEAGEGFVRNLLHDKNQYRPILFIDDNVKKNGQELHGVRVMGTSRDIPELVKKYSIGLAIIAIPSIRSADMRRIVKQCDLADVSVRTLPSIQDLASGKVTLNTINDVAIEDLLGREQVTLDLSTIHAGLNSKVVLVTGGGGSIGSEICRQLAQLTSVQKLIVVENCEYNLYKISAEIRKDFPQLNYREYLTDITDVKKIQCIFEKEKPSVVFHAAAYKHLPMLEGQVYSAAKNNILGTKIISETAVNNGVETFVLISTDKAVRPTNVMGASKRIAEIFCQTYNEKVSTKFITVRFGNVLGSSGSVVPLFKEQLKRGGPITVTHPDVTRFFMTISEASQLILQACVLGKGGEIFVLDMGEPIKISYLAEQLIKLSGQEPGEDIEIQYVGLKPGEKMNEELFYPEEKAIKTENAKIFQANSNHALNTVILDEFSIEKFEQGVLNLNDVLLLQLFQNLLKEWNHYV